MTLGHQDENILRETVRREHAEPRINPRRAVVRISPKAKAGVSKTNLSKFELGTFQLRKNRPDSFAEGSATFRAYASCPIAAGSDVLLIPCAGEASEGYWMALPCDANEPVETEEQCIDFDDQKYPLPLISVEGLVDNANTPEFNGWFEFVNGRHQMQQLFPPTQVFGGDGNVKTYTDCSPAVVIEVPNNQPPTTSPPGPIQIQWLTRPTNVALSIQAGVRTSVVGLGIKELTVASLRENGANPYPRSTTPSIYGQTLVANSKYADWRGSAAGGTGTSNYANLLTWLAAGTFTLYPTS